jgi:DNA processing protein
MIAAPAVTTLPCTPCLRRAWLVGALSGRIEHTRRGNAGRIPLLLALDDAALMAAANAQGAVADAYRRFRRDEALAAVAQADLHALCRHDARYPAALAELPDAPAVVYVAGDLGRFLALVEADRPSIAVVGARRASSYGLEVARGLGRGLASADATVVSGMALGIDSAAHVGALEGGATTVAVLAAGADRAYPASKQRLYREIRRRGAVVSELPPGSPVHRWCFPARNRLIAALSRVTVVVEAMERSGSLITAEFARDLGRDVGAVPGHVTSPLARGPNALLSDGAHVIRHAEDALDLACGVGAWERRRTVGSGVPDHLAPLFQAVAEGAQTPESLVERGVPVTVALAGLAELELGGHLRRAIGGRYEVVLA